MKHLLLIPTLIITTSLLFFHPVNGETFLDQEALAGVAGTSFLQKNEQNGTIAFIRCHPDSFIDEQRHLEWLKNEVLHVAAQFDFKLIREEKDDKQFKHYKYQQYYMGYPVQNGIYIVHTKNGRVVSANGDYFPVTMLQQGNNISRDEAFHAALQKIGGIDYEQQFSGGLSTMKAGGNLVILPIENNYHLAWKFDVYTISPTEKRVFAYIDAMTGNYLFEEDRFQYIDHPVNAPSVYNGTVPIVCDSVNTTLFILRETGRGGGIEIRNMNNGGNYATATDITSQSSAWNILPTQQHGIDVLFGLESSYDYFLQQFGRNSIDNAGLKLNGFINYSNSGVSLFNTNGFVFGKQQDSTILPATSLEIVAHEYTHGINLYTANLGTNGEPGALNESFSDIFGVVIDHMINPTTANYLIGEKCTSNGKAFRNMAQPSQYSMPNTYLGTYWSTTTTTGRGSVQNYWFYLLSEGGSGINDLGNSYHIKKIGMTDAAAIVYRALTLYLTPTATYNNARTASIQAAIDLFGTCSSQEEEVTKAWYAVGIGTNYSGGVFAAALFPSTVLCSNGSINPVNLSMNATSYEWDFGDGNVSTLANPSHTYSTTGNYTITLIANGNGVCSNTDTVVFNNLIDVNPQPNLVPASCQPGNLSTNSDIGIYNVTLRSINNNSSSAYSEGYRDFTCETNTVIHPGDNVKLDVLTSSNLNENVKAWMDYNNDGVFATSELVMTSNNILGHHTSIIATDTQPVLNTPLRLRIMDDPNYSAITGPCITLSSGQAEDYSVIFSPSTSAPLVDFDASKTTIILGDSILFSDLTVNSGTLIWYFPGGTPSTSTNRFQKVIYNSPGTYAVKLVCTNAIGTDSITRIDYISVLDAFNMCGNFDEVFLSTGNLYDPGGVNGNSSGNYNCDFLIDPGCASSITLSFSMFSIGSGNYLYIFNRGPNIPTGSTLLYTGTGNFMPPPITATGGKMLVRFAKSNTGSVAGFAANWTSALINTQVPVAAFIPDNFNPPINTPVRFIDSSLGEDLSYNWDFGDGTSSTNFPTVHEYSIPGTYTITLIAMNCLGADTLSQTITVQEAPAILVPTDTIDLTITCGDSITLPVNVYNIGLGDLLISENGYTDMEDTVHVLAYINHSDTTTMVNPIVNAVAQYFNKFTITKYNSNDTNQLKIALVDKQVLLFPERGNDPDTMYSYYPEIVLDYLRKGGNVVVCGGANTTSDPRLNDMSLLRAKYLDSRFSSSFNTSDTTDILTDQIPYIFPQVVNRCFPFTISNRNKKMLISNNGDDILTYRYYGKGKAVHMGFSVKSNSPDEVKRVMSNCIKMGQYRWPDWLNVLPEIDTIHPGDSTIANFVIKPIKLKPGLHYAYINFNSNDPVDSVHTIVIKINVTGLPILSFADTCFDFGIVTLGDSSTQYVILENSGCDTLVIDSIITGSTVMTTSPNSITMEYSSSYSLPVQFNPQALGNFTDTIYFYSNIGLIKHCVRGTGVTAPAIALSTTSLAISHNACGDSASSGFWLYNTGGNYLHYTLSGINDSIPRKILSMVFGVDMQNEYQNTIASIQQYYNNIIVDTTIFTTSSISAKLANKDIVLFPKQETGTNYVNGVRSTIQQFVNGGGNAIFLGSDFHTNLGLLPLIYQMNMFTGSDTADIISGTCLVSDTTDFYTENINQTFPAISTTYLQKITNTDKLTLVTSSGKEVVSVRKYGKGNAIYIGFDYDTFNPDIQKIIANTVKNIYRGKFPKGIQLFPDSGTVAPGDSVYITINSTLNGLPGGQYSLPIVINGNSSVVENDTVFSQFQIGYNPCADFTFFNTTACNGTMSFTDLTYNPGTSWKWFFGDGDSSLLQSPIHTYSSAGVKTVTFITTNAFGTDTIIKNCSVTLLLPVLNVNGAPVVGNALIFTTNLSQSIYTRFWDFGDGATSSLSTATHAYATPGTYIVTLTLTSTSCTMTVIDTVYITPTALSEFIMQGSFTVHPNPFRNQSEIGFELTKSATIDLAVIDVSGRVLEQYCKNELKPKGIYNFKFSGYPTGMYSVLLKVNGIQLMQKLVKEE